MTSEEQPKLHVDSDWKAQAQAEKERLDREAEATAEKREKTRPGELPEADFKSLVGLLASQAIMYLGAYGDPKTGRVMVDLNGAQFSIDLLDVLEEKTKGNVSDDEANEAYYGKAITARGIVIHREVENTSADDLRAALVTE